ncbi:glycosyltransferase [Demequina sp.]|uniref:glycosyltransferase n=1 Tax=Demequina sp. TaxID=2050685 RepID=UPI0025E782FA|nr:glycosyltransferase [Demequina sp.]
MKGRRTLTIFPFWRDNPYPNLMALATAASDFSVQGPTQLDSLLRVIAHSRRGDVLHFQWTAPVIQRAQDASDARARLGRFKRAIDRFRRSGGRLVWTVHNAMPHELLYEAEELELMRYLAKAADVIHVMNPATAEVLAPDVVLPREKIVVVPHPSFMGLYPRGPGREAARAAFGLRPEQRAVAFVGQIRPYKGIVTLLRALDSLTPEQKAQTALLLAGMVRAEDVETVEDAIPSGMTVVYERGFVPDGELSRWYEAADLAVLPYERILNSGSAHLAATFEVPIVLPDAPHLRAEFGDEPWVRFFDGDDAVPELTRLLADPATYERDRDALRAFNTARSPWNMSERMRDEVLAPS